eukprot:2320807-Ditylum_brightwellii.AAC.1
MDWDTFASVDHLQDPHNFIPSQLLQASTQSKIELPWINPDEPYGHEMKKKAKGILRVYYQNINRITCLEDLYKYMEYMKTHEVDIWMWTETNINWRPKMRREAKKMSSKIFKNAKIITSTSNDPAGWKQQGYTCIGLVNGMVGRKILGRGDNKGLSRWSYVQIAGKEQKK